MASYLGYLSFTGPESLGAGYYWGETMQDVLYFESILAASLGVSDAPCARDETCKVYDIDVDEADFI